MDVARQTFLKKGNVLSTAIRNTSCSRGWLRFVVQSIFATITVASFVLIVIMAVKNPAASPVLRPMVYPRCEIQGCRVICKEAPYYHDHEDDIVHIVSEADSKCSRIYLELLEPSFINNTLPANWLSRMQSNVYSLSIFGGNLMHIPSGAFMSQFTGHINTLALHEIQIKTWDTYSLVGLSSLETLNIINCEVYGVLENSLQAVDDTLETLTITASGVWDPVNFTGARGFDKLKTVDFSNNDFNEILRKGSFVGLEVTKILYINSCKITAIGAGTFDFLMSIEVLYLNNNQLITVPSGLFSIVVAIENPKPRINLEDNLWHCDCSFEDLRQLIRKDILLVETTCKYPDNMNSKTFTQFEKYCDNSSADVDEAYRIYNFSKNKKNNQTSVKINESFGDSVYVNGCHCNDKNKNNSVHMISPVSKNVCSSKEYKYLNVSSLVDRGEQSYNNGSQWFKFSYFLKTEKYSVVQIGAMAEKQEYGLLWYQSTCPNELLCLDVIPSYLRVYNTDANIRYTFCPIHIKSATIDNENCLGYNFGAYETEYTYRDKIIFRVLLYLSTICVCLFFGAVVVYGLIRRKPTLLKGSKRILFVKHKNVDALVLPPKVPLRNDFKSPNNYLNDKDIFTLSTDHKLMPPNLNRIKSFKSNKSGSPSYISAVAPTDDQLAEWRIRHHFNNDLTINSTKSELSTLSWICRDSYYSLDETDKTYESLK